MSNATKTTAELRNEARAAERRLDWTEAARLWDAAADAYPARFADSGIGRLDTDAMRRKARVAEGRRER